MHRLARLLLLVTVLLLPARLIAAERIALVLGMSDYSSIRPLKNAANDAGAVSDVLTDIGFEVATLIDSPRSELEAALADFAFRAETADLALIYFAGHGVEFQGENYLVPADADVRSNAEIRAQSFSLGDFLRAVDGARKMRIVILDSCRDDPFGGLADTDGQTGAPRSAGLAPPDPERGTLVAFAARDGQVALDGEGDNSPFAMALVDHMDDPGVEISLMFRQVRDDVLAATGNLQEPHTYGSLSGIPFYLAGPPELRDPVTDPDPRIAWSRIKPDQELQLAALADTGDTRSMLGLAYMRLNPAAERYDPEDAADLLSRAAEAGSAEAQFELAKLYESGVGVSADPGRAIELYREAADQDFADAINDLGFLYYQGGLGLPKDPDRALGLFQRAADLRHPQAMFNFAALIDDGMVPGKGPADAAAYLYQSLRSGSSTVFDLLSDRPTMFKDATRRALQRKLSDNDFYQGGIDGDFGAGTQRGLRLAYGLTE